MKKYKKIIFFSGGSDTMYILRQYCMDKTAHKYLFLYLVNNNISNHQLHYDILNYLTSLNLSCEIYFTEPITKKNGLKTKGRSLRRLGLYHTCLKYSCNHVVIGHNYSDIVESFFMRLINNSNLYGLGALYKMSKPNIAYFAGHTIYLEKPLINYDKSLFNIKDYFFFLDKNDCIRQKIRKSLFTTQIPYLFLYNLIKELYNLTHKKYIAFYNHRNMTLYAKNKSLKNEQLRCLVYILNNTLKNRFYPQNINYQNININNCHGKYINNKLYLKASERIHKKFIKNNIYYYIINDLHRIEIYSFINHKIDLKIKNNYLIITYLNQSSL